MRDTIAVVEENPLALAVAFLVQIRLLVLFQHLVFDIVSDSAVVSSAMRMMTISSAFLSLAALAIARLISSGVLLKIHASYCSSLIIVIFSLMLYQFWE